MVTLSIRGGNKEHALASKPKLQKPNTMPHIGSHESLKRSSSCSSSIDLSSDLGSPVNGPNSTLNFPNSSSMSTLQNIASHGVHSSSSSLAFENPEEDSDASIRSNDQLQFQEVHKMVTNSTTAVSGDGQQNIKEISNSLVASPDNHPGVVEKLDSSKSSGSQVKGKNDGKGWEIGDEQEETETSDNIYDSSMEDKDGKEPQENGDERQNLDEKRHSTEDKALGILDATRVQASLEGDTFSLSWGN